MAKFTIITGDAAPSTTPKAVAVTGGSPRKSRQNQNFGGLSSAFKALSMPQKAG